MTQRRRADGTTQDALATSSASADAGPTPARGPRAAGFSRGITLLLLTVMGLMAIVSFAYRSTTAPVGADAPGDVFSASRAISALAPVVQEPRPIGSPANDAARAHLYAELERLGFEVVTREALGIRSAGERVVAGYNRNLVATRPGTDPTGTLVLATHIDSVPMAPGAGDAGVGIAVILESVRALGLEAFRNDLVVLLVDGEEDGLLGAEAFVREGAGGLAEPILVLNHEARGIGGRPIIARTNGPIHPLLDVMPRPEAESFLDALFAIIPNDTDFTVYREAGWWGMDMAIVDGSWAYHSPQDDLDHLDPSALQHYGDLTLALAHEIGDRDLGQLETEAGATPVMTTGPLGVVRLPSPLVAVLGVLALVAVLAAVVVLRIPGSLRLSGVLLAMVGGVIALGGSVAAGIALWEGAKSIAPRMLSAAVGEPVHAQLFIAAEIAAALTVLTIVWMLLRLRLSPAATALGLALPATLLVAALAVIAPALGGWLVLPVAAAAVGGLLAVLLPDPLSLMVRILAITPMGWMLGQQVSGLLEFGIASSAGGVAGTVALGLLAAAALLAPSRSATTRAVAARVTRGRHLLIPAVLAVVALVLAGGGIVHTSRSGEPAQARAFAHVDGTDGSTIWEARGTTDWARALDGTTATSDLPAPVLKLVSDQEGRIELELASARDATQIELTVGPLATGGRAALHDVILGGHPIEADVVSSLTIVGMRPGQTVRIEAATAGGTPPLTVTDATFDLTEAGGYSKPPGNVAVVHSMVQVSTTVEPGG